MNTLVWIIQSLLVVLFLMAGFMKTITPREKLIEKMAWTNDFTGNTIKLIGVSEVLGALGPMLPMLFSIFPLLTPVAALCLLIVMLLAIGTHARRKEKKEIMLNSILAIMLLFVTIIRF